MLPRISQVRRVLITEFAINVHQIVAEACCLLCSLHPGVVSMTRLALAGSTRLHPFSSRGGHVNAFTQLPNVLSTEYWLRKATTESENGDIAVSQACVGEELQCMSFLDQQFWAEHGAATKCEVRLIHRAP